MVKSIKKSEDSLKILLIVLSVFLLISVFSLGFFSYPLLVGYISGELEAPFSLLSVTGKTISSPSNFIERENILVYPDKIVIALKDATVSSYEDTGSMEPILDSNSNGIRIKPEFENEIQVGDIVSFRQNGFLIVHRVIEKGIDSQGVYFITKGDNNNFKDGKIRFQDIEYITIGILY